jgi:hypothetical protein
MPAVTNIAVGDQPVTAKEESLEGIIAACREAKSQFRPLTKEDLNSVKAELVEALARLDAKLKSAGDNGQDWSKYLLCETLQKELQKEGALDQKALNEISSRYFSGNEGLGLVWFVDVRWTLWRLLKVDEAIDNPRTKATYERTLDNLINYLQAFAVKPTTENTLGISESLRWLQIRQQAPELVKAVQQRFNRPNMYGEASAEFVQAAVGDPVDDNAGICDCILGTSLSGSGHTVGHTTAELIPDDNMGVFNTLLFATTYSATVGSHPPVCIFSTGTTCIGACKRVWINEYGIFSCPAASNAVTQTCINDIQARRKIVEHAAWKRAGQQKSTAECIASQHAEVRVNKRVDEKAAEQLDKAQENYLKKYRNPLVDHKLFPEQLKISTDKETMRTVSLETGNSLLAAPTPPPSAIKTDLVLRVHESLINNFALDALGGMTVNEDDFQQAFINTFGKLPDKMKRDENEPPWIITFAIRQPISVTFSDAGFKILIRGTQFENGDSQYGDKPDEGGMDVIISYKIVKTDTGFNAVRQKFVQDNFQEDFQYIFYDRDHKPKKGVLTPRETGIKAHMTRRLRKSFENPIIGDGFFFSGNLKKVGKMLPVDVQSNDGWLYIAWRRAQTDQNVN